VSNFKIGDKVRDPHYPDLYGIIIEELASIHHHPDWYVEWRSIGNSLDGPIKYRTRAYERCIAHFYNGLDRVLAEI
jgi:deoxyadenosine/deoxycytidine kinase